MEYSESLVCVTMLRLRILRCFDLELAVVSCVYTVLRGCYGKEFDIQQMIDGNNGTMMPPRQARGLDPYNPCDDCVIREPCFGWSLRLIGHSSREGGLG